LIEQGYASKSLLSSKGSAVASCYLAFNPGVDPKDVSKPRSFLRPQPELDQAGGWLRSGWAYSFVRLAPDINKKPRMMPGGSDLET
jgi:hypothetical protein